MSEAGQERAIGRIEGKLDLIIADQEKARQDRKQQYERLEKIERSQEGVERKVEGIHSRLEKVEEPVAEFNRWRERGVGAMMLVSFVAATFGAVLATLGKKLLALING
ncbi:hypothetical protein ACI50E_16825 [Brucella sp. ZJ1_1]|uniref:hypothetical protein n=1 Tax=Brucella sp. ZJ1_1 TaxID=3379097 RepID=UPI0038522EFC